MSRHIATTLITLALVALTACRNDTDDMMNVGFIMPEVTASGHDAPDPQSFALRLTATTGGSTHTWESVDAFSPTQGFQAGTYLIEAFHGSEDAEGFGMPYYYGAERVNVTADRTEHVTIACTRRNVAVTVEADGSFMDAVSSYHTIVHSVGGAYFDYPASETCPLYVRDGTCEIYLTFTLTDGRKASVLADRWQTPEGYDLRVGLSHEAGRILVSGKGNVHAIELDDNLFATVGPSILPEGFDPAAGLTVSEGITPQSPVRMKVTAHAPLAEVVLTVQSPALRELGVHPEINLLGHDTATLDALRANGAEFAVSNNDMEFMLDLTGLLDKVRRDESSVRPTFSLIAIDRLGQVSEPLSLTVNVEALPLRVEALEETVIGSTEAAAVIVSPAPSFADNLTIAVSGADGAWTPVPVTTVSPLGSDRYRVEFTLPHEEESSVKVRFSYMDNEVATLPLQFTSPRFTIEVDAFARHAVIRVNPANRSQLALITRKMRVYTDGSPANIYNRDEESGLVWVTGLTDDTTYKVTATLFESPVQGDFSPELTIHTESIGELPNSGFEEIQDDISYKDLPMGGRYSQNAMPLYNRQNHTSVEVKVPKSPWATVNAKTFCLSAANPNTWYMQPSTMESSNIISGAVSVKLVSVAFDPAGEPIPDYRQLSQPYVSYNPNVPRIAYRAAGKLFLGSYSYSPGSGEHYEEGIAFSSRPSAINGKYRYLPGGNAPSDCGRVDISLVGTVGGKRQVIATATGLLYPTATDATFSVPVTYGMFGVKAESLRVMISSSRETGDIATETAGVVTSPDPLTSSSTGSVLEIDGLSLSY